MFVFKSLGNLGADEVPKGIGREISEQAFSPMDVLKTPQGVSLWLDSQQILHPLIPLLG